MILAFELLNLLQLKNNLYFHIFFLNHSIQKYLEMTNLKKASLHRYNQDWLIKDALISDSNGKLNNIDKYVLLTMSYFR